MKKIIITCLMFVLFLPVLSGAAQLSKQREAEIRHAVISYLQQKHANLSSEIRLKRFVIAGNPYLPEGLLDYEVSVPQQWGGWGNANMAVIVRQGDRTVANVNARTEVEVLVEMVFAARQVNFGSVIDTSDLVLRKHDIGSVQGRYLARIDDAVGKRARITIRPNVALRTENLEKIPIVKSGQLVMIVAENERMRITVTGKARSAGSAGDTIIVQNLNSLKELSARIINAETVQIVY